MQRFFRWLLILCAVSLIFYGTVRIYYRTTHGFTISNISSDFAYDARWEVRPLIPEENRLLDQILNQKFHYLGKGCQSYVFESEDKQFVIKFFKYQRFRIKPWVEYLSFIPFVNNYKREREEKKLNKLHGLFSSWKIAFEELQPETGLVYVHLNKSSHLNKILSITDKIGLEHKIDLDQMEFLIQHKAKMLCSYIEETISSSEVTSLHKLMDSIISLIISEYQRGYADNDHALMQNTGVLDGQPIHIDVGQFVKNEEAKKPEMYKQDLFNKTYKFRKWLQKDHPDLAEYLEGKLVATIGDQFHQMQPHFKPHE